MKSQKRLTTCVAILAVSVLVMAGASWAEDTSDVEKRIEKSADVLNEIMGTPDKAIPDKVMSDAKCIAVVPSMVKIAVGFGGNHGKGVATCRTAHGWSAPAPITITGGSWGLQLGGGRSISCSSSPTITECSIYWPASSRLAAMPLPQPVRLAGMPAPTPIGR